MTVPSGLKSHIASLAFSVGLPDGREAPGGGRRGPRAKFHATRLSLRAQGGLHSWASVVHRVESLGYSFKNKFFSLFKDV